MRVVAKYALPIAPLSAYNQLHFPLMSLFDSTKLARVVNANT